MRRFRLSRAAENDILEILAWSEVQFGSSARERYERLIAAALRDIAADPVRPGSVARPELGEQLRSWHLRGSRERARAGGATVRRPRHFVIYRPAGDLVLVGRILHDGMELERHLSAADIWE